MNKDEQQELHGLRELFGKLQGIQVKYINQQGAVKLIAWGKDYRQWPIERQLEYSEALASSMNNACDVIQKHRDELIGQMENLRQQLQSCEKSLEIQRTNNINSITNSNATKQEMAKAIRKLEKSLEEEKRKNVELELELSGTLTNDND